MSKITRAIRFCASFELPLRGHDETADSENPGIFRGLLEYLGKLDATIKDHLMNATVFKGNSKTIQNELLDCMLEVCREKIITEIEQAISLAVMSDDTTHISEYT